MIPGLERSPGEGNGTPLHFSCLENLMDRGAWRATVHGVTKSPWDMTEGLTLSLLSLFLKEEEDNLPPLLLTEYTCIGSLLAWGYQHTHPRLAFLS